PRNTWQGRVRLSKETRSGHEQSDQVPHDQGRLMAVIARDTKHERRARRRALAWSVVIVPFAILCIALAVLVAADQLYADRALPGVSVAGVNVGSLTRDGALERLQGELARPWADSTVVATYGGREWRTTNG